MSAANSYYLSCKYTSALRKKEKKAVYRRFPKKKKNVIQPMWNWTVGAGRAIWEGERKENEGLSGMRERVETRARYIIASRRLCWRDEEGKKRKEKKRRREGGERGSAVGVSPSAKEVGRARSGPVGSARAACSGIGVTNQLWRPSPINPPYLLLKTSLDATAATIGVFSSSSRTSKAAAGRPNSLSLSLSHNNNTTGSSRTRIKPRNIL